MRKLRYLSDKNLSDSQVRTMLLLNAIIGDRDYISETNEQLGKMIGKSGNAIASSLYYCAKKGYVKSINHNVKRKLYILK